MTGRTPLLELSGLHKRFGGVEALVDVDLTVRRGEVVGLVGDNAAGKSTLARIITGVYQPDGGTVMLSGTRCTISSPRAALELGIATVFQEFALVESLDIPSNLFLGRELVGRALLDEQQMEDLARTYLDQLNSRITDLRVPLKQLSAGQRQCVAIARTLVTNPELVVLDEPTASLSVAQTAEVLDHIQHLRELGLGVILISHNLSDVRAVADRVEVLRHGRNNGSFDTSTSYEQVLSAITGATMHPKPNRNTT